MSMANVAKQVIELNLPPTTETTVGPPAPALIPMPKSEQSKRVLPSPPKEFKGDELPPAPGFTRNGYTALASNPPPAPVPLPVPPAPIIPQLKKTKVLLEIETKLSGEYSIRGIHSFESLCRRLRLDLENPASANSFQSVDTTGFAINASKNILTERLNNLKREASAKNLGPPVFKAKGSNFHSTYASWGLVLSQDLITPRIEETENGERTYSEEASVDSNWSYWWVETDAFINIDFSLISFN